MKEEIKEILDDLLFTTTLPDVSVKLSEEKLNQLKDYITNLQEENERLNNIINELKWKPIEQYEKPKYDWVLVKYYIEPNFECIPAVAEKRFDKWYNRNDEEIIGDVRYFMDMQQIDKLNELKGE